MKILRYVLAFLAGALVTGFVVAGFEALGHAVYPPQEGPDPANLEQIEAAVAIVAVLAGTSLAVLAGRRRDRAAAGA